MGAKPARHTGGWKIAAIAAAATVVIVAAAAWLIVGRHISFNQPPIPVQTKSAWAAPLNAPGLTNFYQVSDDLYRGAQPTAEGVQSLEAMGIKTILNLRSFHSDRGIIDDTDVAYEHLYVKAWHPEDEEVASFLRLVTDPNSTPVFVHCQHGSDRTGLMCAVYRVAVQGWTKDQAIEEMTTGPYGFHKEWQNLIEYLREMDIDAAKRAAQIPQ